MLLVMPLTNFAGDNWRPHFSEDYKFDAWLDYSEYPDVPAVSTNNMVRSLQGKTNKCLKYCSQIQASFVFKQEAGDSYTKADLEKFFKDFKRWTVKTL